MTRPRVKDGARKEYGLPRVTADDVEARALRLGYDHDPGTPAWAREMFDREWAEIRFALARKLLHGFKLWECGGLLVSKFHPLASTLGDELATAWEREDVADLVEKVNVALVGQVMRATEERELRTVALHPLHPVWTGPVWIYGRGA